MTEPPSPKLSPGLSDEDKAYITEIFLEQIVPKLDKLGARLGVINCDFAGKRYEHWNIQFQSSGSAYEIVNFEYDEDARGLSLEL